MRTSVRLALAALLAALLAPEAAAADKKTCVSHAGAPDFALAGKPPARNRGLTFCTEYGASTCCDRATSDGVRRVVAHMQANGFSSRCREVRRSPCPRPVPRSDPTPPPTRSRPRASSFSIARLLLLSRPPTQAWTALECSICDPRAGVTPKTSVCSHTCDSIYRACKDEYFSEDAQHRMVPCRASDTICAKLSDWMAESGGGGKEMCEAAGYDVVSAGRASADGEWCFEGTPPASATSANAGASRSSGASKSKKKGAGGSAAEAEEFARLSGWMTRVYVAAGIGLAAHFGLKYRARNTRTHNAGAARNAARVAAENRSRRAAEFERNAKML